MTPKRPVFYENATGISVNLAQSTGKLEQTLQNGVDSTELTGLRWFSAHSRLCDPAHLRARPILKMT